MSRWLFRFFFLGFFLASVTEQDDEWIDPYNMTHYDSTSKTMRKNPEELKKAETQGTPSRDWDQDEINSTFSECSKKLVILQSAIEDIKHKASILKQQPGFVSAQNTKLNQLLKSIEQLKMPHKDDFCHFAWLNAYLEEARRFISVGLLIVATHFTNLSEVLSQPDVTRLLVPVGSLVTILVLIACIAVKRRQGQLGQRDGHVQNEENDLHNDGREEEPKEGDRDNLDPEDRGQEPVLVEDVGPEQEEERNAEPPGQEPNALEDECCDENYSSTHYPVSETQPDMKHCAE